MWHYALIVLVALVLVAAAVFMISFVNFVLGGIILASGIIIAAVALWGFIDTLDTSTLLDGGRSVTMR